VVKEPRFDQLKAQEIMLVQRARQLLDKEEALMSLERQLIAKQEALIHRERCLRSEQLATTTSTVTTPTITTEMPPLIQIHPGSLPPGTIVGFPTAGQPLAPRIVGSQRRPRVTLMYQPDRQLQLQQMHAGRLLRHARLVPTTTIQQAPILVIYFFTYCIEADYVT